MSDKKDIRFRKGTSQRSGFDYKYRELIKDGPFFVGPDERDEPPPSRLSLGGEGDINQGVYFRASTASTVPVDKDNPTFFITAAGGISPIFSHPYMRVSGSNSAITISANPRISSGRESQVLTLFCTDSTITIGNGNGVSTMNSKNIVMRSGAVTVFMFHTANNAWSETSRVDPPYGIGG